MEDHKEGIKEPEMTEMERMREAKILAGKADEAKKEAIQRFIAKAQLRVATALLRPHGSKGTVAVELWRTLKEKKTGDYTKKDYRWIWTFSALAGQLANIPLRIEGETFKEAMDNMISGCLGFIALCWVHPDWISARKPSPIAAYPTLLCFSDEAWLELTRGFALPEIKKEEKK